MRAGGPEVGGVVWASSSSATHRVPANVPVYRVSKAFGFPGSEFSESGLAKVQLPGLGRANERDMDDHLNPDTKKA